MLFGVSPGLRVGIFLTPNIVTSLARKLPFALFPSKSNSPVLGLLNPANEFLCGARLPYFPMNEEGLNNPAVEIPGGLGHTTWGGMEAGPGMFYRAQVVDGEVHRLGGEALRAQLSIVPVMADGKRIRIGSNVVTNAAGKLIDHFDYVVHTAPPMYTARQELAQPARSWSDGLSACYQNGIESAIESGVQVLFTPLLGAGARGSPVDLAMQVAVEAMFSNKTGNLKGGVAEDFVVLFGVQEHKLLRKMAKYMEAGGQSVKPSISKI